MRSCRQKTGGISDRSHMGLFSIDGGFEAPKGWMAMNSIEGGCYCGTIRYRFTEPRGTSLCYCANCRRASGAQSLAWVGVPEDNVQIVNGEPATYIASNSTTWYFCSTCGTTLFWKPAKDGPFTVTIGSLDDPAAFPPTETSYDEDRLSWEHPLLDE